MKLGGPVALDNARPFGAIFARVHQRSKLGLLCWGGAERGAASKDQHTSDLHLISQLTSHHLHSLHRFFIIRFSRPFGASFYAAQLEIHCLPEAPIRFHFPSIQLPTLKRRSPCVCGLHSSLLTLAFHQTD